MTDKPDLLPDAISLLRDLYERVDDGYQQFAYIDVTSGDIHKIGALLNRYDTRAVHVTNDADDSGYKFPEEQPETALQAFDNMVAHYRHLLRNTNSIVEEEFSFFEDEIRSSLHSKPADAERQKALEDVLPMWEVCLMQLSGIALRTDKDDRDRIPDLVAKIRHHVSALSQPAIPQDVISNVIHGLDQICNSSTTSRDAVELKLIANHLRYILKPYLKGE